VITRVDVPIQPCEHSSFFFYFFLVCQSNVHYVMRFVIKILNLQLLQTCINILASRPRILVVSSRRSHNS
jgi:hypothetical protein